MQIVIKMADIDYEFIKQQVSDGVTNPLKVYIANGKPLPKGHGTLKDVDNIKTAFPSGEYVRTESVRATIDHEKTIIEADTESEN